MKKVRGFWQHENGKIYAIESDSFGKIVGGVGPIDPDNLLSLDDYQYKTAIVDWIKKALAEGKLRRIDPS